mgnify:FL=1
MPAPQGGNPDTPGLSGIFRDFVEATARGRGKGASVEFFEGFVALFERFLKSVGGLFVFSQSFSDGAQKAFF